MSPGINVCTRKWHPQHAEIAQIKQKGPGQLLLSYLSTCSNRLLQFCNLHALSWVDLHWSLINCRLRILGLSWYTPLVEVNQAIFAWSFRQISVYPRETISTLRIMRFVPARLAFNLYLTRTNIDWQANSNITFYTLPGLLMFSGSSLILKKAQI